MPRLAHEDLEEHTYMLRIYGMITDEKKDQKVEVFHRPTIFEVIQPMQPRAERYVKNPSCLCYRTILVIHRSIQPVILYKVQDTERVSQVYTWSQINGKN